MSLLTVHDVHRSYRGPAGDVPVLRGVSLQVPEGGVHAIMGPSGSGKSTLVNALVPDAARTTGHVNDVTGRGRHTSASLQALELPGGGWVIDTPGVRSFGVAHVSLANILRGFPDLAEVAEDCPRGCTHQGPPADPECALDRLEGTAHRRAMAVRGLLTDLTATPDWA